MRVKRGVTTRRRHKKLAKLNKGYRGSANNVFRRMKEAWIHAGVHMYRSRKQKKRDFRGLWIIRISAAVKALGFSYSKFIGNMKKQGVEVNRKMLSEIAIHHPKAFESLVQKVME